MKITILSDTHGRHNSVHVPEADIIVHCGDCTDNIGRASLSNFLRWFELQKAPVKCLIAGNHDGAYEKWPDLARLMTKELAPSVHYLQDSGIEIDGVKFWGSPYQPEFCNWHFNLPRGAELKRHWDMIPEGTDVLVTHGPPKGILDVSGFDSERCGCEELLLAVQRVKPNVHCFGHIHHDYGTKKIGETTFINASICDERYQPTRHPFIYNLP